jgi:hypothetical protein
MSPKEFVAMYEEPYDVSLATGNHFEILFGGLKPVEFSFVSDYVWPLPIRILPYGDY